MFRRWGVNGESNWLFLKKKSLLLLISQNAKCIIHNHHGIYSKIIKFKSFYLITRFTFFSGHIENRVYFIFYFKHLVRFLRISRPVRLADIF